MTMTSGAVLDATDTLMFREAEQSAAAVASMLAANRDEVRRLAARIRDTPPAMVITCARGSSDNAATYGRYLIETQLGIPTGSFGQSVASVYGADVALGGAVCLAISQSGASEDLLRATETARRGGAFVVAIVNTPGSPVTRIADMVLHLEAGPERSVAATKSYVTSLAMQAWLVAQIKGQVDLLGAVESLPDALARAWDLDWSPALDRLKARGNMYVLGRGPGLAAAQEAALKLKETSQIHAEGVSAAEVLHGPVALARPGFSTLIFSQDDATRDGTRETARKLVERGVDVMIAGASADGAIQLPTLEAHPEMQPILAMPPFYRMAAGLSVARGLDPDNPPHLSKVTRTI